MFVANFVDELRYGLPNRNRFTVFIMFKPYKYTKELPSQRSSQEKIDTWELRLHIEPLGIDFKRLLSAVFVISGLFLITGQVVWPLLTTPRAQQPLLKPTSPEVLAQATEMEKGGIKVEFEFEFSELRRQPDSGVVEPKVGTVPNNPLPTVFYVSIPKLGVERAEVGTNSENLSPDERLGHYPGSALPGEVGNTFIYGHSASPMFYDPKNYRTVFSTLDKLKEGDEITVEFGGKYFKYVVEKSVVLNPEDVRPLEPIAPAFLRQSYLTLMTCVPPGIRTKRLLVQARLQY